MESIFAGQRFSPAAQAIAATGTGQVAVQCIGIAVGHRQMIDIEHRITEPGSHERVANVMHVRVGIDVPVRID